MEEDQSVDQENLQQPTQSFGLRPYNLLARESRRLGRYAIVTYGSVKQFLQKEVPMPKASQLLGNINIPTRKAPDQIADDLKAIVSRSHEVLASARTVFPMSLFPDTVILDRTKVTIIKRSSFMSESVISIRIEDVLNVSASTGPFFGSLNIASRVMSSTDHFQINFFWRKDAAHLKHIIQGYVIAQHNNISVAHLSKDDLIKTLTELGTDSRP